MKNILETINTDNLTIEQIRNKQQEQLKMIEKSHEDIAKGNVISAEEYLAEIEKENAAII